MTDLHPMLQKQMARARLSNGGIDMARLAALVSSTYQEADADRRRTEHTIRMMVEELDHRAEHDPMTGLANRDRFTTQLCKAMGTQIDPRRAAVLFLDLDRFKEINDTMGHFAGDEVLRIVARRLFQSVGEKGLCARLGGDEFAVVLWDIDDAAGVSQVARAIIALLSQPMDIDGKTATVGVSVGIALTPDHGRSTNDLQRRADMALYRAKQNRCGEHCFFEQSMDEALINRRTLELDLRSAIANDHFQLHFQPIVEARSLDTRCYEALIRWNDPIRGLISPTEFIPIAEASGLIVPIGEWVIRNACLQAQRFPDDVSIAINISPAQLRSDNLVSVFEGALAATGIDPSRVEVEITESVLLDEDPRNLQTLRRLRALGLRFALDDFGTGHSSLNYLQKFHFDKIKIDRSFCASINRNATNAALVRAVATLGRDLGIEVVAEGVETVQESEALVAEGCGYLQGFYYGRPTAPNNIMGMTEIAIEQARELLRRMHEASEAEEQRKREKRPSLRLVSTGK